MSYTAQVLNQEDGPQNNVVITVGLKDNESGELVQQMDVGLSNHQLEDGKFEKRLERYGKKLLDRYQQTSSKPSKDSKGAEVEI